MNQQLDFTLPQAPPKRGARAVAWLTFLVAIGCLGLLLSLLLRGPSAPGSQISGASPEDLRGLAEALERRTLYGQAAAVWAEYSRAAVLSPGKKAEVVYRQGKNLKEAGRYAEAVRFLTEYEQLDVSREDRRRAVRPLSECLSALGKEEVRENVLKAYTIPGETETGTVVARVGGDAITLEDLRGEVARQMRHLLRMQGVLDAGTAARQADEMARERLKDPKALQEILQQVVQTEVLYREALAQKYESNAEYRKAVVEFRRGYLANQLIQDHVQEALKSIGPTDLENHYEANKEKFVAKEAVEFSYQQFATEEEANAALLDPVDSDFTPGQGAAVQGEPIPGLGRSAEATAQLLALQEGSTGDRPIPIDDVWYVFRADKKLAERERAFEEAADDVRADLARIKQAEAAQKLQQRLAQKFPIEIVEEALRESVAGAESSDPGETATAESKDENKENKDE